MINRRIYFSHEPRNLVFSVMLYTMSPLSPCGYNTSLHGWRSAPFTYHNVYCRHLSAIIVDMNISKHCHLGDFVLGFAL